MITVSLCMIVKDEEDVLERCLSSVHHLVDEIIIVDTGSTDRTKEIAGTFTDNIYDFEWVNDFSAARNFSFSKATKDYIFWLDADDVLEKDDQESFLTLKQTIPSEVDSVMMNYHITYDHAGRPTYSTMRNRLVKREKQFKWRGAVHEYLDVQGVVARSNTAVYHKKIKETTDRNLNIYKERLKNGDDFSPRDLFYYGNELVSHGHFDEALTTFENYLTTNEGWVEDQIAACIQIANVYAHFHNIEKQITSLCRSFLYDNPRAEICCRLGELFLNHYHDVEKAIFWYELATTLPSPPDIRGLFHQPHTWTWLPHLQLSVCYEQRGEVKKAIEHCRRALELHPDHFKIKHNLHYLESLQNEEDKNESSSDPTLMCGQSIRSFQKADYYHAYSKLFQLMKHSPDHVEALSLLAAYASSTGCREVAHHYIKTVGYDRYMNILKEHRTLLEVVLFQQHRKRKWEELQKPKSINERNRIGVTAPLCYGHVLEVGCAAGHLSTAIAMHADTLYGIDIDPVSIELARYNAFQYGLDNCYFTLGDGAALPLPNDRFDTVVLTEILQQAEKPDLLIKEAIRVCKPKGRIIMSVPRGYALPDAEDVRKFTKETLKQLISTSVDTDFHVVSEAPSPYILGYVDLAKAASPETVTNHNVFDSFLPPHPLRSIDKREKVTIIIPTYNRCQSLVKSLESVLAQTYPNKEIIVVNDGSTDETEAVLANYQDQIMYLKKENGGLSSAVNLALKKATGQYVWVFADDDIALPKKLELQVRKFQEDRNLGLIHTSAILINEQNGNRVYQGMWQARDVAKNGQLREKLKGNFYFSPTVLVKKEVLEKVGPYDETLRRAQDYDLWLRISKDYQVAALPVPTVHYTLQQHANPEEIARKTKEGDQTIIRKARNIPLEQLFPKDGYGDEVVYEVESLLERAVYMAHHGLMEEFTFDLKQAKTIASKRDLLNFSRKGLQMILHLNQLMNQINAPDALMHLYYFIDQIEKANQP